MRRWHVAGAIIETAGGVLLVRNLRRNGDADWTPPGGVIEVEEMADTREGLAREVLEETGLTIESWGSRLYGVEVVAPELGWIMNAQVWSATVGEGAIAVGDDPDGIVTHAEYVPLHECTERLASTHQWVSEPLLEWLEQRWDQHRSFRYRLTGTSTGRGRIDRL